MMNDKNRDILLYAIKHLNIPLLYPGLNNGYVFNIDIKHGEASTNSIRILESLIVTILENSNLSENEKDILLKIIKCDLDSQNHPTLVSISKRLAWLDNGSKMGEYTKGQLVINPENITGHLKDNNLNAKEISIITQDTVNSLLEINKVD
jgi:hypothetical protein